VLLPGLAQVLVGKTSCVTICVALLKFGALIIVSVRRIEIAMARLFPFCRHGNDF
jgi:hypothetical protein